MASKSFREVVAWQKAHAFVLAFYKTKPMFPDDEKLLNAYCIAVKDDKGISDE